MKRVLWGGAVASLVLMFAIVLGVMPTQAQVSSGSVSGTIVDPSGSSVPDATVKARNRATGEERTTVSDSSGQFRITLLSVGEYTIEVTKQGFRKLAFASVTVVSGQNTGLGVSHLEVGDVTTTVEVSETAPLVDSTEAQISNTISSAAMATFPGVQENQGLDVLALTVPGVVGTRDVGFSNTNGAGFAVEGIRGRNNDQQIDGQNNNDNSVGGPSLFVSDTEFVSEYQITTNNFGAEYGRNSGSVVNILTKSGTNTVHGSIYGTEGNSGFDSLSNIQKEFQGLTLVPHYNDSFVGATVGGPMWKDKLFYFGGFDTEIVPANSVYASGSLTPTPAGIAALETCFPGPNGTVSASLQDLAKFGPYGVTAGNPTATSTRLGTSDGCSFEEGGVERTLGTSQHSYNWVYKMDLNTEKNHFFGRYFYNKSTFFNTDAFGTAASGYPANVPALSQDYAFSWVRSISSRMTNEFRAIYGRENVEFGGNSLGNTIPNATQLTSALARVTMSSPNLGFGPATNAPQGRIVNTYQLQDNWTYTKGRHAIKSGVNFTYQRSPNFFLPNVNGNFNFTNWGNFAQNLPSSVSITSGNPVLDFREHDTFLYGQDDFKLKNNLTLTLGLTWSYYGQPANLFNQLTSKQQASSTPFWDPTLPTSITTFPSIPAPKNSFGPNVGFAWTPGRDNWLTGHGKTTLRGGYRLAYDPPVYNIYLNISSAAPNVLAQTITANPPGLITDPFGPAVRQALASSLVFGVKDPRTFNQTTITPNFGPQMTDRWSFGIQRELSSSAALEVRYVGNHATNLYQSINENPRIDAIAADFPGVLPAGVTPCTAPVIPSALGRVNCNEGVVRQRTNSAYSDYNGVETELRTNNLWNQLTMRAGYTYSKTTDNADEIFGTFGAGGAIAFSQNPLDFTGAEHSLSALDFPHRFTLAVAEQIPFFRAQHGVFGHVLGGWTVSSVYTLSSGQPYTPVQFSLGFGSGSPYQDVRFNTGFAGNFDGGARPFAGSASAPVTQVGIFAADACNNFGVGCALAANQLISLNAINQGDLVGTAVATSGVRFIANGLEADQVFGTPFGNVGRNTLRDWKINNVNFDLIKSIKFWERVRVELHLTALNAFNHPQYGSIDPFLDDAGLATQQTGFGDPFVQNGGNRTLRMGLRITF